MSTMPASPEQQPDSGAGDSTGSATELDVRQLAKPQKHPTIFATYAELPVGGSFVLINDHDPRHLRDEFEVEHPGSFGWEYLRQERRDWRIRISKLTSTPLPRVLIDTAYFGDDADREDATESDPSGVAWNLPVRERDLDSNVIALPPDGSIEQHAGPELDVLIHVLGGTGCLETERGTIDLAAGTLLWLPRRSRRAFAAGPTGLRYLTVHQRRQSLTLEPPAPRRVG